MPVAGDEKRRAVLVLPWAREAVVGQYGLRVRPVASASRKGWHSSSRPL